MSFRLSMGLMGLGDDGTLYLPSGGRLIRLPMRVASIIQRLQHGVAKLSWRL